MCEFKSDDSSIKLPRKLAREGLKDLRQGGSEQQSGNWRDTLQLGLCSGSGAALDCLLEQQEEKALPGITLFNGSDGWDLESLE